MESGTVTTTRSSLFKPVPDYKVFLDEFESCYDVDKLSISDKLFWIVSENEDGIILVINDGILSKSFKHDEDSQAMLNFMKENGAYLKTIELRKVAYWDDENKRCFEFITNLHGMNAGHIALIYKKRWQIELMFKQLKQNFPLKFFLGDNENAIKIQIWCALIVNLLLTVIHKKIKRKWAFSNLASFCRLHTCSTTFI